ncbi:MAG: hypothetical protein J6B62_05600 [Bacteroidales bacterium]|jgi:hypothetical protein|nr:hypothetical protein [Bacteroidales bacterium]
MKKIFNIFTLVAIAVMAFASSSCEKQTEWGFKKIYMPQSIITNKPDHEYPVPMTGQQDNNYSVDNGKLKVFLGVYRSGQGDLQSFSVDVYYDEDASAAAAKAADRVALQKDAFELPAQVNVPDGSRQNTFYLTVDLDKIKAEHPEYKDKKMIVVVGIRNPTKFELNEDICKTIVVIDGSKFI